MFLSTACTLAALAAGLACLLLALFAPWLAGPLVGGDEYAAALRVFLLQVFAQTAVQVPLEILRLRERTSAFAAWSLLLGGTPVAAGALALFLVPRDLVAMLAAQGVGALTILAAVYLSARRDWHLIVDSAAAGAALRFGLPLIPVMAANWVMLSTDRFVLTHTAGLAVAGRYAVSVTAGRVIELVIQALNMAWAPRFFARAREPDFGRDNRATLTTLVLGTACLVYGFLVVSADVTRILLPSASPDVVVVAPIIGAACGIMVLYYIYVNVLYLERRTVQIAVNVTVGAFAAVALNLLLTPRWHMTGAALSLVGAVIILVTATVWSARGHRVIMLDRTAIVWAVSSLAVLAGLGISLRVFNTPGAPGWKALLFAIGLGAVGFIGWRRGTYRFHSEASESTAR